jgi:hypothetical protein
MPLFRDRLRADAADNPNRQSLLFLGTGFVDVPPGRVFVPLVGRQRWVPSQQDELAYWRAFPPVWLCFVLLVVFFGLWNIGVSLRLLPEIPGGLAWPLIGAAGIWLWRRTHLVRQWPLVDPALKRSKLVLASLERWSAGPMSLTFVLLAALGVWVIPDLLSGDESAAPATADPEVWALAILALFAFAYFRAIFWLAIALAQRARRSAKRE